MIQLVMFMVAAYGMTTILVYGSIFNGLRDKIKIAGSEVGGYLTRPTFKFISDLISCMLCTGTWVGFLSDNRLSSFACYKTTEGTIKCLMDFH